MSLLTEGLVERGVDVTLFATADSITTRAPRRNRADRLLRGSGARREGVGGASHRGGVRAGGRVRRDPQQLRLPAADLQPAGRHAGRDDDPRLLVRADRAGLREVQRRGHYVAISDADRHERLDYAATIHHGIDMHAFEVGRRRATTCCSSVGSIPTRGPRRRSRRRASGHAARDRRDRPGRGLLRAARRAALDGERSATSARSGRERRGELLGGARALLHLVSFDEPFGFSVVEAMACGTPVIAHPRGSMAEIVRHGENGFLVETRRRGRRGRRRLRVRSTAQACAHRSRTLRRRPDGGRLPRSLSGRRGAPPRSRDRQRGSPLSPRWPADRFRVGVNYWPARTAMSWWSRFDREEVAADFARIVACGLDSVRVFLTWEDFQPAPNRVDRAMLERLVAVADLAGDLGLALIPTLFTGHMSGVNWIPAWALGSSLGDRRFRVVSRGDVARPGLRNWYTDPAIGSAQALLAEQVAGALAGHEAVWVWDLGNENSNCVTPPTRASARTWLARLASAIRGADETALVTVGLHMEDLEEDRRLGRARPPERAISSRCTATRSTRPGPTVRPTNSCSRSWRA